jgi:hypothetical protein
MASSAAAAMACCSGDFGVIRWISAKRAKLPPSPRLSARMVTEAYLTVTTRIRAHSSVEITANTCGWSTGRRWWPMKFSPKA